jgi:alanine dehydrogenase
VVRIGVPKEIKTHEYRVGLVPAGVAELAAHGHQVVVEKGAGAGIGVSDDDYRSAGAAIAADADGVFSGAELIVKVKEPLAAERRRLRPGQTLFTYLHLAADRELTVELMASGATCIAYETVTADDGQLPLLAPMSEVAGRMSIQAGAYALERERGGRGVLLGGVPGVPPAKVVILGGGVVGSNAALMAVGLGAQVVVIDRSLSVLRSLVRQFGTRIETAFSTTQVIERHLATADLVIGGVLVAGARAPKLVSAAAIARMRPGAVVVDVSIDQGGCFETSRPTTHADPTYVVDEVVHYCVANMPGAVPHTSTIALTNATLPFILDLADKGVPAALREDRHLQAGLNVHAGRLTCAGAAEAHGLTATDPGAALTTALARGV